MMIGSAPPKLDHRPPRSLGAEALHILGTGVSQSPESAHGTALVDLSLQVRSGEDRRHRGRRR